MDPFGFVPTIDRLGLGVFVVADATADRGSMPTLANRSL